MKAKINSLQADLQNIVTELTETITSCCLQLDQGQQTDSTTTASVPAPRLAPLFPATSSQGTRTNTDTDASGSGKSLHGRDIATPNDADSSSAATRNRSSAAAFRLIQHNNALVLS